MDTDWSKPTKHIVSVGLVLFGLYVIFLSRTVLMLLVVAALLAFLLMPIVGFFRRRLKIPRGIAVLLAHILLVILILLSPLILIPPVISGFNELARIEYQVLFDNTLTWTKEALIHIRDVETELFGVSLDFSAIVDPALSALEGDTAAPLKLPSFQTIINSLQTPLTITVGFAANLAGSVFSGILTLVLTFLFSIYISLDAHKLSGKFIKLVPPPYRSEIATLLSRLRRIWRAYFRGQLNLMLTIGIFTWIVALVIGLPNSFTLAVIAGVLELLPGLGPFLAAVPAVLLALLQGSTYLPVGHITFALIVIGCYVLIQQIENNFIVPRVIGDAVELPPLIVLIGVVVGASVAGILGALLAAPVVASTKEIMSYLYAKILGNPPFPPQQTRPEPVKPSWLDQAKRFIAKGKTSVRRTRSLASSGQQVEPEASREN